MATATGLAATKKVDVLRAGVWKPRSRPGQFEGVGLEALQWLAEAKKETGLKVAVEVARPAHVESCVKFGVDMVWLGARTTVNPFLVQELADACKGSGLAVMVKNPVSPDLRLWVGAIERMHRAGIERIIAVHRGFQTAQTNMYRNSPLWEIPLALKRLIPGLPLFCDPSHLAGSRRGLPEVSRQALALGADGLMIESHHDPVRALTDPDQQITPEGLGCLLESLSANPKPETAHLDGLRAQIDDKDFQVLALLASRMAVSQEIGRIKAQRGESVLQQGRLEKLLAQRMEKGGEMGLDAEFVKYLVKLLHDESVRIQKS